MSMLLIIVIKFKPMKYLLIQSIIFMLFSCIDPDQSMSCKYSIRNNSNYTINFIVYYQNEIVENIDLTSQTSGLNCNYSTEGCTGYSVLCNIDSLKITFPNGNGHLCGLANNTPYLFSNNQTPFQPSEKFVLNSNGVNEFIITEEDYINAHDLP